MPKPNETKWKDALRKTMDSTSYWSVVAAVIATFVFVAALLLFTRPGIVTTTDDQGEAGRLSVPKLLAVSGVMSAVVGGLSLYLGAGKAPAID